MASPKTPAAMRVVVVDDGRLQRECLVAQLLAAGFEASGAWDLPSLFSAVDAGVPSVIVLNIDTADLQALLHVDTHAWRTEVGAIADYLEEFGERTPAALFEELDKTARQLV